MQVKSIAEEEHSAILSTIIKLPFELKIFILSIFERPFYTGFTVMETCNGIRIKTRINLFVRMLLNCNWRIKKLDFLISCLTHVQLRYCIRYFPIFVVFGC